mmetsp:Transcript_17660/g.52780  ORF Transcript_17660/g.52780 Transcript_17660/m.52780 type:complete len:702 (+) Transcript_17660:6804-8909(+)
MRSWISGAQILLSEEVKGELMKLRKLISDALWHPFAWLDQHAQNFVRTLLWAFLLDAHGCYPRICIHWYEPADRPIVQPKVKQQLDESLLQTRRQIQNSCLGPHIQIHVKSSLFSLRLLLFCRCRRSSRNGIAQLLVVVLYKPLVPRGALLWACKLLPERQGFALCGTQLVVLCPFDGRIPFFVSVAAQGGIQVRILLEETPDSDQAIDGLARVKLLLVAIDIQLHAGGKLLQEVAQLCAAACLRPERILKSIDRRERVWQLTFLHERELTVTLRVLMRGKCCCHLLETSRLLHRVFSLLDVINLPTVQLPAAELHRVLHFMRLAVQIPVVHRLGYLRLVVGNAALPKLGELPGSAAQPFVSEVPAGETDEIAHTPVRWGNPNGKFGCGQISKVLPIRLELLVHGWAFLLQSEQHLLEVGHRLFRWDRFPERDLDAIVQPQQILDRLIIRWKLHLLLLDQNLEQPLFSDRPGMWATAEHLHERRKLIAMIADQNKLLLEWWLQAIRHFDRQLAGVLERFGVIRHVTLQALLFEPGKLVVVASVRHQLEAALANLLRGFDQRFLLQRISGLLLGLARFRLILALGVGEWLEHDVAPQLCFSQVNGCPVLIGRKELGDQFLADYECRRLDFFIRHLEVVLGWDVDLGLLHIDHSLKIADVAVQVYEYMLDRLIGARYLVLKCLPLVRLELHPAFRGHLPYRVL